MMRTAANLVSAWAPAKINLYLEVGRVQSDGYHPLDSLVVFADTRAADRISARPATELTFNVSGPAGAALGQDSDNLVMRAAHALRQASGLHGVGADITLHKHLPTAAGLGGGSADAAATLHLLNQLWEVGFADDALAAIGAELGADVPACVYGRPSWMRGIGDKLTPVTAPDLPAVLVNPGVPVSTEAVFKRFDTRVGGSALKETPPPTPAEDASIATYAKALSKRRNDLQKAACDLAGAVKSVLDALSKHPDVLLSRMSGSGGTCFGVFATLAEAEAAAETLQKKHRRWWVRATLLKGATPA